MEKTFDEKLREMISEICQNGQATKNEPKDFEDFINLQRINKSTFGEIIGVSGSTINKYLNQPMNLKISQVVKLAEATNTDVREIINLIN